MDNQVRIGKITYFESDANVLGEGSEGTKVCRGTWDGREVAIKRLDCGQSDVVKIRAEINALIKCDAHKNVVRYFGQEVQDNYILLALELFEFTLEKWVDCKGIGDNKAKISRLNILQQATEGLNYLHSKKVVHRDIKPKNILLRVDNNIGEVTVKISDFGICKILPQGKVLQAMTGGYGAGTDGWKAPEVLNFLRESTGSQSEIVVKLTTSSDIFSLGCLYYYVLTWGNHPFGLAGERNANVLKKKGFFDELEKQHKGFSWLLQSMTSKNIGNRPPASAIVRHHIFWSKERCVTFLVHIKNRAKETESSVNSEKLKKCKTSLEMRSKLFHGSFPTWFSHLCPVLSRYLKTKTKYGKCETQSSVMDLIRLIRNMHSHISDDPPEVKEAVGMSPSAFFDYWLTRFPYIITVTWLAFQSLKKLPEYGLKDYYPEDFDFQFKSFKN